MGRACSTNGEDINAYRILVGKPEGKRPLGRPRRRWEDNIKMCLREITKILVRTEGTGSGFDRRNSFQIKINSMSGVFKLCDCNIQVSA
jgi:hypothetical protein